MRTTIGVALSAVVLFLAGCATVLMNTGYTKIGPAVAHDAKHGWSVWMK